MGFYGNISTNNKYKSTFQFDKIYNNRKQMDAAAATDGVYVGRYVLVDYDPSGITQSTYQGNFDEDALEYGDIGRGWDSTVWQKTYQNNEYCYVMIANLNSAVPALDLVVDAPTATPIAPYWDEASSNLYYKLHVQPSWGMKVKDASQGEISDVTGKSIYWNQAGFDKENRNISDATNAISITTSKANSYADDTQADQKPDTYELSILLPEIGNIMASVWDVIYGTDRNTNVAWGNLQGESAYRKTKEIDGVDTRVIEGFDDTKLGTVAGIINSVHDLMGMIIVKPEIEDFDAETYNAESLSDNNIYLINNKYYFRNKIYQSANDETGVWRLKELTDFAGSLNTLHGLILKLNRILSEGDAYTKDRSTIQGTLNKLNEIIDQYNLSGISSGLIYAQNGSLNAVPTVGDDWINVGPVEVIENGQTVTKFKVSHKINEPADTETIADKNTGKLPENSSASSGINQNTDDTLKLFSAITDDRGHVTSKNTETVTLPYGFKTIKAKNNTKSITVLEGFSPAAPSDVSNDLIAKNTKDEITFESTNNWIKLDTNTDKTLRISHKLRDNYAYSVAVTDFNQSSNGNSFEIPDWKIDGAGHVTAINGHSYILPSGFKTISIGEDDAETEYVAPTVSAINPIDTLVIEPGDYVTPTISGRKLKFDISIDNISSNLETTLQEYIDQRVHEAVYGTTIQSNFWGAQIPIISGQSKKVKGAASSQNWVVNLDSSDNITYGYGDVSGFYAVENGLVKIKQSGTYRIQASLGLKNVNKYVYSIHIRIHHSKNAGTSWNYICGITESFDAVAVAEATHPVFGTPSKIIELEEDDLLKLEFEFRVAADQTVTEELLKGENSYLLLEKVENSMHRIKFMFDSPTPAYNSAILNQLPDDWKWGEDLVNVKRLLNEAPEIQTISIDGVNWYFNGWQEYILTEEDIEAGRTLSDIKNQGLTLLESVGLDEVITEDTEMLMNYKDHLLVGSWSPKREVTYAYSDSENLPEEVRDTLPRAGEAELCTVGDTYTISDPTSKSVHANKGDVPGTWTFDEWTTTSANVVINDDQFEMPDNDVTITGSWTFTPDPHWTVTYGYTETNGENLPQEVINTLPADQIVYHTEAETSKTVALAAIPSSPIIATDNGIHYIYDFNSSGWTSSVAINEGNITISNDTIVSGVWTRTREYLTQFNLSDASYSTEDSDPHYTFPSDFTNQETALTALNTRRQTLYSNLDNSTKVQKLYYGNSAVLPSWSNKEIEVTDNGTYLGTWTFAGWEPNSYTSNTAQRQAGATVTAYDEWTFSTGTEYRLLTSSDSGTLGNYLQAGNSYIIVVYTTAIGGGDLALTNEMANGSMVAENVLIDENTITINNSKKNIVFDCIAIDTVVSDGVYTRLVLRSRANPSVYLYPNGNYLQTTTSIEDSISMYYNNEMLWNYMAYQWNADTTGGYSSNSSGASQSKSVISYSKAFLAYNAPNAVVTYHTSANSRLRLFTNGNPTYGAAQEESEEDVNLGNQ